MKIQIFLVITLVVTTISSNNGGMMMPRLPLGVLLRGNWSMVDDSSRIVGGTIATPGEFPYQISLQRSSGSSWSQSCGGSIYNEKTILTAAHCVIAASISSLRIVAGEYNLNANDGNEQTRPVQSYIYPSSYSPDTIQDDIALLKLSIPLNFNAYVGPVTVPSPRSRPADGTSCTVSGWGTTNEGGPISNILRKVDVPIVSDEVCKSIYGPFAIKPGMICAGFTAGGSDSCQGDSGGPLVLKGTKTQIGIVSWGNGCAKPSFYGVYTLVSDYIDWITRNAVDAQSSTSTSSTSSSSSTTSRASSTPITISSSITIASTVHSTSIPSATSSTLTPPTTSTPSTILTSSSSTSTTTMKPITNIVSVSSNSVSSILGSSVTSSSFTSTTTTTRPSSSGLLTVSNRETSIISLAAGSTSISSTRTTSKSGAMVKTVLSKFMLTLLLLLAVLFFSVP